MTETASGAMVGAAVMAMEGSTVGGGGFMRIEGGVRKGRGECIYFV